MNPENLKNDLQQVLNSDLALRKEFNELKRSLSDYRNQLIMRDEDCKRLQVTIDVLNTKLVVIERDNTTYKGELQSFKELRGTIKEQLQAKQDELESRLSEIEGLKTELSVIASNYEAKIESIQSASAQTIAQLKSEYEVQLSELRSGAHYKEMGLREEYENRLLSISQDSANQEQTLARQHQEAIQTLTNGYEAELTGLKSTFENYKATSFSDHQVQLDGLKNQHEHQIITLETGFKQTLEALENKHRNELAALKLDLEEQRNTSVTALRDELNALKSSALFNEQTLKQTYEVKIEELTNLHQVSTNALVNRYTTEIELLKTNALSEKETLINTYEQQLTTLQSEAETKVITLQSNFDSHLTSLQSNSSEQLEHLISEYEEKLSNTLIHSNSQNTRLTEELSKTQLENDHFKEKVREMVIHIDSQNEQFESLTKELQGFQWQLESKSAEINQLQSEFESYKLTTGANESQTVQSLRQEIDVLSAEMANLAANLETTTNLLAEAENNSEGLTQEIKTYLLKITTLETDLDQLNAELQVKENKLNELENLHTAELSNKEEQWNTFKDELEINNSQQLKEKEIEFQKLLVENTNLIQEIDSAQDKIDAQENEIQLLKTELGEINAKEEGRVNDWHETLQLKNFELTTLQANNAAMQVELNCLKNDVANLTEQLTMASQGNEQLTALQHNYDILLREKQSLFSEINELHSYTNNLNETIVALNAKLNGYEAEVTHLTEQLSARVKAEATSEINSTEAEQEAFIDRLFKQIDVLNDERMSLLNEKEAMANQLLKMNEVVGTLSQEVDSQNINVLDLNNHRKNIILASSSNGEVDERSQMKSQINELLREMDKCIALLSA